MRSAVIAVSVVVLLAWLAYHATGSRFNVRATTPRDIPIVGMLLSELVFVEPANYHGFEHPHGGGTFTVEGTATRGSVVEFCDSAKVSLSKDGTEISDRHDILTYLMDRETTLPEFYSEESTDVLCGYGGRFPKLYGVYEESNGRFLISLQFDGTK